ncbi:MAG TPA: hypothetical protein VGE72_04030 [Azospirillum sp.]
MERRMDPTLSELLDDPLVLAVMSRDGVSREHLLQLMAQIRRNLRDQNGRDQNPHDRNGRAAA